MIIRGVPPQLTAVYFFFLFFYFIREYINKKFAEADQANKIYLEGLYNYAEAIEEKITSLQTDARDIRDKYL